MYGIKINVGANLTDFRNAMKDADAQITLTTRKAGQAFGKVDDAATDAGDAMKDAAKKPVKEWTELVKEVKKAGDETEKTADRSVQAFDRLKRKGQETGDALGNVPKKAEAGLSRLKSQIDGTESSLKKFGVTSQESFGNIAVLTAPLAAVFAALSIGVGSALKTFGDFQAQMNQIAAVSDLTKNELESMTAAALKLGATTKFSASEAALGMAELSKAGFTAQQTLSAIPGVMNLAAAGGVSVAQAAELAGGALRGFGLDATQAQLVADLLAQAANKSAVDITDLQYSFKYIAPVAASAGQSMQEMTTAVAIMGNNMIKADQAGTTMRAALVRLIDPPKDAAEQLQKLGVSIQDTNGKMLPFSDILDQLRTSTAKYTDVQRNAAISNIFGAEALSGIAAMLNTAKKDYDEMAKSMNNVNGVADRMAGKMNQGIKPAIEQLNGAIESLAIQFGNKLAPAVTAVAKLLTDFAAAASGIPDWAMKLGAALAVAGIAVTGFGVAAGGATIAIGALVLAVGALELPLIAIGAAFGAVALAAGGTTLALMNHTDATDDSVTAVETQVESLSSLVKEYETLKGKTNKSREEQEKMEAILKKIQDLSPGLVTGFNQMGVATDIDRRAIADWNVEAERRLSLLQQTAMAEKVATKARLASAKVRLKELQQEEKDLLNRQKQNDESAKGPFGFLSGIGKGVIAGNLSRNRELQQSLSAEVASTEKDLFVKEHSKGQNYDVPKPPPVRAKVGETAAQRKARLKREDAARKKKEREAAAAARRGQAIVRTQQRDALGDAKNDFANSVMNNQGGFQGKKKIITDFIIRVDKEGLAKTKEGARFLADLQSQLKKTNASINDAATTKSFNEQLAGLEGIVSLMKMAQEFQEKKKATEKEITDLKEDTKDVEADMYARSLGYYDKLKFGVQDSYRRQVREINDRFDGEEKRINAIEGISDEQRQRYLTANANARQKNLDNAKDYADREARLVAVAWVGGIQQIGGELSNLANDPSLENIGNYMLAAFGDPSRVDEFASAIQELGHFIDGLSKGSEDAKNMLGTLVEAGVSAGVLAGSAAAVGLMWNSVGKEVQRVAGFQQELTDITQTYVEALREIEVRKANGVYNGNDMMPLADSIKAAEDQIDALVNKTTEIGKNRNLFTFIFDIDHLQKINKEIADTKLVIDSLKVQQSGLISGFEMDEFNFDKKTIDDRKDVGIIGDKEAIEEEFNLVKTTLNDFIDKRNSAIKDGNLALADSYDLLINQFVPKYNDLKARAGAAKAEAKDAKEELKDATANLKEYSDLIDGIAEREYERDNGGRDSYGNRISLEAERDLEIQTILGDLEEKRTEATKQQAELRKQITKSVEDEKKAILEITNEGIAERAKTEAQDKASRIADVQADAQEKRDALTAEINGIEARMVKEDEAARKQISNVKILSNEKLKALNYEIQINKDNAKVLADNLKLERSIAEQIERQARAKAKRDGEKAPNFASAVNSSGQVNGSTVTAGTTANNMSGDGSQLRWDGTRWNRVYHDGVDEVPGYPGQEIPAILEAGERVISRKQVQAMNGQSIAAATSTTKNYSVNFNGDINITESKNGRDSAEQVTKALGRRLGRGGLPII